MRDISETAVCGESPARHPPHESAASRGSANDETEGSAGRTQVSPDLRCERRFTVVGGLYCRVYEHRVKAF